MPVALITGGSAGFGFALATALADRGWDLILDARGRTGLHSAAETLNSRALNSRTSDSRTADSRNADSRNPEPQIVSVPGDVADPAHRRELAAIAGRTGRLDLLVNNASELGPSPLPALPDFPLAELETLYRVNLLAPIGLIQLTLPLLSAGAGTIVNLSSDAAVEAYPGWGGYGSSKAALDQLTAVLAVELAATKPDLRVYGFDPGDLRTAMHQRAFPGEDISDRPEPSRVVPALLRLIDERPSSGRYRAGELLAVQSALSDAS